jgi:protein-tyrosine phosphatase
VAVARWEPTFSWITPHLAVGGHVPPEAVPDLAEPHGIAAVVDLRAEACDDRVALARHGIALLHLPTIDHGAVSQRGLDEGVAFANAFLDRGARVLVHCQHGIGRSALLSLCILVDRGEAPLSALERAKQARWMVSPSPAQYEAWATWLRRRQEAGAAWEVPGFDAFKAIAYRHIYAR